MSRNILTSRLAVSPPPDSARRHGVCLSVHGAQNPIFWDRGIARYIVEHAAALLELATDCVHSVRASDRMGFTPSLVRLLQSGKVRRTRDEPRDAVARRPAIHHVMSPLEWGYDIEDVWPLWARDPACLRVVTLYDLIPFVFPHWYQASLADRVGYGARVELIRRADHVLAISEHTARDATEVLGIPEERITVIGAAATAGFRELWPRREDALDFVRRRFAGLDRSFAFYVGGQDERKNLWRLIEAWARLGETTRDRTRLVISCGLAPDRLAALERHAARHGLRRDDLVLTGRVDDHELAALYRACTLFVFASLYEGSGLPILEAMTAEAPVVAARTSTGPELLGDTDGTFDPLDVGDMARVIGAALDDPRRLERYRARSAARVGEFSWRRVAECTLAGYERALARRRHAAPRVRRARCRLALIAPGPRPAGPADAALDRLVAHLRQHAEVEVIRAGAPTGGDAAAPARFELRRGRDAYDRVIHVLGAEPAHRYPYETLVRDPGGIVLFEDVRLGEFHRWYGARVAGPVWLRRELDMQYGESVPPWIGSQGTVSPGDLTANGLLFTGRVQRLASAVVVPSPLAAALLDVDRLGEADGAAAVAVLAPLPPPVAPPQPGATVEEIAAVAPWASADLLVDVLAMVTSRVPSASLSLYGHDATAAARERLLELARDRGLADRLSLRVPEERRHGLRRAAVALLPRPAIDASSIAFAQECLAAGVPVVAAAGGRGVLEVPADASAGQLAEPVVRLLTDPEQRAARAGEGWSHLSYLNRAPTEGWLDLLGLRR